MIKLASEKSFNRSVCPIMNIKGKTVNYPFKAQYGNFNIQSAQGILGPKQMMIMDILGTKLIHYLYGNQDFSGRIPLNNEKMVKDKSGLYMSAKLLKHVTEKLSPLNEGIIPEAWYDREGKLANIDKTHRRDRKSVV